MKKSYLTGLCVFLLTGATLSGCGTGSTDAGGQDMNEAETARLDQKTDNVPTVDPKDEGAAPPLTSANIGGSEMTPAKSVVQNVSMGENLTKFYSALIQADMVQTLNGSGPYTVFAPTDEAIEGMSNGTSLGDLMKPENKERLRQLIQNHVVTGQLTTADLKEGTTLKTVGGRQLSVTKMNGQVMVNGAALEKADEESSNGVIHVVNKVFIPAQ